MKVDNISFKEYTELAHKSEYDKYIKFLKPKDILNVGDFTELSFGFVKDMQEHFNHTGMTWANFFEEISRQTGKRIKHLAQMSVYEINQQLLYCKAQVIIINNIEKQKLSHVPDADEKAANIERFSIYRSFLQFDKLAGGDVLKLDAIRALRYDLCLTKLALDADNVRFTKQLQNIKNSKKPKK